jgi:catechol 2,3-dioxygenase-like lactoylglutathione lyase family enzyme
VNGEGAAASWYTRPILGVADIDRSSAFYVGNLGFKEDWRHVEGDRPLVVQISRAGCELILSSQWPDRVGRGLTFISLDLDALNAVRTEFESQGVAVKDGRWGYPLMVVEDPDGNALWFPYPVDNAEAAV